MVSTSVGVDKTRTDPNSIAGRAHATFQEVAHAEAPSIFPSFVEPARKAETRVSRYYEKVRTSGELRDDLFYDAIRVTVATWKNVRLLDGEPELLPGERTIEARRHVTHLVSSGETQFLISADAPR